MAAAPPPPPPPPPARGPAGQSASCSSVARAVLEFEKGAGGGRRSAAAQIDPALLPPMKRPSPISHRPSPAVMAASETRRLAESARAVQAAGHAAAVEMVGGPATGFPNLVPVPVQDAPVHIFAPMRPPSTRPPRVAASPPLRPPPGFPLLVQVPVNQYPLPSFAAPRPPPPPATDAERTMMSPRGE